MYRYKNAVNNLFKRKKDGLEVEVNNTAPWGHVYVKKKVGDHDYSLPYNLARGSREHFALAGSLLTHINKTN